MLNLTELRKHRAAVYYKEMAPYFVYVAKSGLLLVASFIGISLLLTYFRTIRDFPEHFPMIWVALAVLTPVMVYSPIRTYIREADLIYLLPVEPRMRDYFLPSWQRSSIFQSLGMLALLGVLWPLYIQSSEDPLPYLFLGFMLTAVKLTCLYGAWQAMKVIDSWTRWIYTLIRWALPILSVSILFQYPAVKSALFLLSVCGLYIVSFQLSRRERLPWQRMLESEQRTRHRVALFLSWFTDGPDLPTTVKRRKWMASIAEQLPFKAVNTYRYLYVKTFIRTELFEITVRLVVLACVLIVWIETLWLQVIVGLFFIWIIYIQLSSLKRIHQHNVWTIIFPTNEFDRKRSIQSVIQFIYGIIVLLLIGVFIVDLIKFI